MNEKRKIYATEDGQFLYEDGTMALPPACCKSDIVGRCPACSELVCGLHPDIHIGTWSGECEVTTNNG